MPSLVVAVVDARVLNAVEDHGPGFFDERLWTGQETLCGSLSG